MTLVVLGLHTLAAEIYGHGLAQWVRMFALGHEQTFRSATSMAILPAKADISERGSNVR